MRPDGWFFLIVCWGALLSLATFCYSKVLKHKKD